ncbi:hypothetical protein BDV96DRAFT_340321 [Lophiotrema nucula]|uniref:Uncharacterized protein n=1 Tax=Lophiotrema nucula TaxID=690887 RepID=A0A6A5YIP9_9PLEO|nr:hypothetical protein BDV96DRAFT_340321 [Lophiotrema nucula]
MLAVRNMRAMHVPIHLFWALPNSFGRSTPFISATQFQKIDWSYYGEPHLPDDTACRCNRPFANGKTAKCVSLAFGYYHQDFGPEFLFATATPNDAADDRCNKKYGSDALEYSFLSLGGLIAAGRALPTEHYQAKRQPIMAEFSTS